MSESWYNGSVAQKWDIIPTECKSIKVTPPYEKKYIVGEKIDTNGMKVTATFKDGTTVDVTKNVTLSYTNTKAGSVKVTVSYSDKTDSFNVTYIDKTDIFEGSGTKSDPYLIYNMIELSTMRDLVNSTTYNKDFGGKYYKLMADIDLRGVSWKPIGKRHINGNDTSTNFFGYFDGNHHTIKNMNIPLDTKKFSGFFGSMNGGIIENLAVEGNILSYNDYEDADNISVGGILGELCGSDGIVRNCSFIGEVKGNNIAVGGIVGYIWQSGVVENCYSNCYVYGKDYVGGIVGRICSGGVKNLTCRIENCYHVNTVKSSGKNYGTIFGGLEKQTNPCSIEIINCYGLTTDGQLYGGAKADVMEMDDKTSAELKKLGAELLGDAFVKNPNADFNNGYPVFPWQAAIKGDVNKDGSVSVADLVMLEKYLLGSIKTLSSVDNADLCEDGKIDTYDIVLLRKILVEK